MTTELKLIIEKLNNIQTDINEIKKELKEIKEGTVKMDRHINFVDGVYDKVKSPFHYILESVDKIKMINYNPPTNYIEEFPKEN